MLQSSMTVMKKGSATKKNNAVSSKYITVRAAQEAGSAKGQFAAAAAGGRKPARAEAAEVLVFGSPIFCAKPSLQLSSSRPTSSLQVPVALLCPSRDLLSCLFRFACSNTGCFLYTGRTHATQPAHPQPCFLRNNNSIHQRHPSICFACQYRQLG